MDLFELALIDDANEKVTSEIGRERDEAVRELGEERRRNDTLEWNMGRVLATAKALLAQRDADIARLNARLEEMRDAKRAVKPSYVRYIPATKRLEMAFDAETTVGTWLRQADLETNPGDGLPVLMALRDPAVLEPSLHPKEEEGGPSEESGHRGRVKEERRSPGSEENRGKDSRTRGHREDRSSLSNRNERGSRGDRRPEGKQRDSHPDRRKERRRHPRPHSSSKAQSPPALAQSNYAKEPISIR